MPELSARSKTVFSHCGGVNAYAVLGKATPVRGIAVKLTHNNLTDYLVAGFETGNVASYFNDFADCFMT